MINWDQHVNVAELAKQQAQREQTKKARKKRTRCKECRKGFWQHDTRQLYCTARCRDRFHLRQWRRKWWVTCPECHENPIRTRGAVMCRSCQARKATAARRANVAANRKIQQSIEKNFVQRL